MANFLAARRKQVLKPDVPNVAKVEALLANEPIEVSPVNAAGLVLEEPLQVIRGPIPELVLDHRLGSNIQHILEDLDLESEDSVGMHGDNSRHPATYEEADQALIKPLSPIPEEGAFSRMPTPDRTRGPTPPGVDRASESKWPRTSKASECESSDEVRVERANWTVRGKLARLGGDLKGNPFKAVAELIDHNKLQMECDVSANDMAEDMLFF